MMRVGWKGWLLWIVLVAAIVVAVAAGGRAYRSFLLLRSAVETGMVETGSIRGWMTLQYLADGFDIDLRRLNQGLDLAADTDPTATLKEIAERRGILPFDYLATVQQVVAAILREAPPPLAEAVEEGWYDRLQAWFLSAVLVYGYPAFALVLLLGAFGLPVPTGLSATIAGSLAGRGEFDLVVLAVIAVGASALGDLAAYGVGRFINPEFMRSYGRWVGYTARNRDRIEMLFRSWGPVSVLLTRTFASHLSSVASLLAGFHSYAVTSFFLYSVVGRMLWTAGYLGLGYLLGGHLETASRLLGSLSVTLVAVAIAVFAVVMLLRGRRLAVS